MCKIYYLGTCDKCRKILRILEENRIQLIVQDIKKEPITTIQLEEMKALSGSYESLFSKVARKYKTIENKEALTEVDYKKLILSEYTFLKRPVLLNDKDIFIGINPKKMEEIKNLF